MATASKANTNGFLILEGLLSEAGEFQALRGFEAARVPPGERFQSNDIGFRASIVDKSGKPLLSVVPEVAFPVGCVPQPGQVASGLARIVIPSQSAASEMVVTMSERDIYRALIASRPPSLGRVRVKVSDKGLATISYKVKADPRNPDQAHDHVQIHLVTRNGQRYPIILNAEKSLIRLDLAAWAGMGSARIAVVASGGFRTSERLSRLFKLPAAKVTGQILYPRPDEKWEFGSCHSLVANLSEAGGRALEWADCDVGWSLDGKPLEDDAQIALCPAPEPGPHKLELWLRSGKGRRRTLDSVGFSVMPQSEGQKLYEANLQRYLEAREKGLLADPDAPAKDPCGC